MDNRLTFLYHLFGVKWGRRAGAQPAAGLQVLSEIGDEGVGKSAPEPKTRWRVARPEVSGPDCQEKPLNDEGRVLVPQSDTGRRVEDTQANGRTLVKELGKLTP